MNINRDNYESYFIDYLDGNLTSKEAQELQVFILLNSDLAEMLEDMDKMKLNIPIISYPNKSKLKKNGLYACPDYYEIAAAENSLTKEDHAYLQKHPLEQNFSHYSNLKLKPDLSIHYSHKVRLYHNRSSVRLIQTSALIASLLVLLGMYYFFRFKSSQQEMLPFIIPVSISTPQPIRTQSIEENNVILQKYTLATKYVSKTSEKTDVIPIIQQKKTLPIMKIIPQPITAISSYAPYQNIIVYPHTTVAITHSEIYLAESASTWKPSEKKILSDNIFTSIIQAGKIIAGIIKNKENDE